MIRRRDLPNLNDIRAFEAAARAGGFTQAADQLNVQQPAISRRIGLLEDWLGAKLFHRRGPNLTLTDVGHDLLPSVEQALGLLESSCAAARRAAAGGPLTVSVSISFAGCYLIRRLPEFYAACPDTEVQIVARYANEGLDADADVFVYFNEDPTYDGPDLPVFLEDLIVVCTPEYLRRIGGVRALQDLLGKDLLVLDEPAHRGDWAAILSPAGLVPPAPRPAQKINNFAVYLNAIQSGRGIGLAWREMVQDLLAQRGLVQPVETSLRSNRGFYLRHGPKPEAAAFADWLTAGACRG